MTLLFSALQCAPLVIPFTMATMRFNSERICLVETISPPSLRRGLVGERLALVLFGALLVAEFGIEVSQAELERPFELLPILAVVCLRALIFAAWTLCVKRVLKRAVVKHGKPPQKAAIFQWLSGDDLPDEGDLRDRARVQLAVEEPGSGHLSIAGRAGAGRLSEVEQ